MLGLGLSLGLGSRHGALGFRHAPNGSNCPNSPHISLCFSFKGTLLFGSLDAYSAVYWDLSGKKASR